MRLLTLRRMRSSPGAIHAQILLPSAAQAATANVSCAITLDGHSIKAVHIIRMTFGMERVSASSMLTRKKAKRSTPHIDLDQKDYR